MTNTKRCLQYLIWLAAGTFTLNLSVTDAIASEKKEKKATGLQQRIDFGSSYILGQSIKSGAVYLLHRKQSEIKGMLEVRQDYRNEIIEEYDLEKSAIVRDGYDKDKLK